MLYNQTKCSDGDAGVGTHLNKHLYYWFLWRRAGGRVSRGADQASKQAREKAQLLFFFIIECD